MDNKNASNFEVISQDPVIYERKIWNLKNLPIAIMIGFIFIIIFTILMFLFNPDLATSTIVALTFVIVYSIILFFLLEPSLLRQVNQKEIHKQTIDRPVEVYHTVEKPVEVVKHFPFIREVPVVKDFESPKTRTVYIARPAKKLNIPHYDFYGSSEIKTYHKSNCRLAKLIKRKYKVSNNSENFFKKKGFSACKVCVLKKVKV